MDNRTFRLCFCLALLALIVMNWSTHKHAEEAACAAGVERACGWHFW